MWSSIVTYKLVNQVEPTITHDTLWDTVEYTNTVYKPKPYIVHEINTDTIYIPTDSTELVNRYKDIYSRLYASKTYRDTLKNDSIAKVIITTHLSNNSLDSLNMWLKIEEPKIVNTTIINNGAKISVGLQLGYKQFSPIATYTYNKNFKFGLGYDIINKNPNLIVLYKLK